MKFYLAILTLSFVFLGNAVAQELELEKIVITPSRTEELASESGRNVDIITSKMIADSQAKDITDVLEGISSINVGSYGGQGATKTVMMRGSTASQVLVMMDGRPINSPRDGQVDFSNIPLNNVERVEVLRGPASNLYGSSAMGGTINIITKNPPRDKMKTDFTTGFGTFKSYTEKLNNAAKFGKFGYLLSAEYDSSAGFRQNSDFEAKSMSAKLQYELAENNKLTINGGASKNSVGTPGPTTSPDYDDRQTSQKSFMDLSWSFKPDETLGVSAKIFNNYERLQFDENSAYSIFDTAGSKSVHKTQVRGIQTQLNKQIFHNYELICGFDNLFNYNDSTQTAKHDYTVYAGYLENKINLTKDLKTSFGFRFDEYSNFGSQTSPSVSLNYNFKEKTNIHALFSRSFRAPTFNDLYWPNEGWAVGNPELKPEKGTSYEFGLNSELNKFLNPAVTYFRSTYDDLIQWAPDSTGVWTPQNVSSALIQGVEFVNTIRLNKHLKFTSGYTYLSAKDKDNHKYLVYQPQQKADFALKLNGFKGFGAEIKGQLTDSRFNDADNTLTVKRFFTMDFNLSKKLNKGTTFYFSVNNLLNEKYQFINGYPMPGLSVNASLKFEI